MIDRTHPLPVIRQCQILSLARSTAYYRPQQASDGDLALMRRIDKLHPTTHSPAVGCCETCCDGSATRSAASMSPR
jgi:hypothetical protein